MRNFTHKWPQSGNFHFFPIFEKVQGRPPPPLITRLLSVELYVLRDIPDFLFKIFFDIHRQKDIDLH